MFVHMAVSGSLLLPLQHLGSSSKLTRLGFRLQDTVRMCRNVWLAGSMRQCLVVLNILVPLMRRRAARIAPRCLSCLWQAVPIYIE